MAYEALGDFFPSALAVHEALRPGHVRQLFPPGAGRVLALGDGTAMRNALLLPVAAVGAAVGVAGFMRLRPLAGRVGRGSAAAAVQVRMHARAAGRSAWPPTFAPQACATPSLARPPCMPPPGAP